MYQDFIWCEECRNFVHFDMGGYGECNASGADRFYCQNAVGCPDYKPILALPDVANGGGG